MVTSRLDRITITFTAPADPAGEGFVILDSTGVVREPERTTSDDGMVWVLAFTEPLPAGDVGVRWTVQAPDAHPIQGSFRFVVAAPVPTPMSTPAVQDEAADETSAESSSRPPLEDQTTDDALAEFLQTEAGAAGADALARVAAVVAVVGAVIAAGVVSFVLLVLGSTLRAPAWPARVVLAGSFLAVGGAAGGLVAQIATLGGGWGEVTDLSLWGDTLGSAQGIAVGARALGGVMSFWSARQLVLMPAHVGRVVPAGVGVRAAGGPGAMAPEIVALAIGAVLLVVSFAFDGHTVSEGPRVLHAAVNVAHVGGVAIWVGGAGMLAWLSRRPGATTKPVAVAAARFSVVATAVVVIVGVTGLVMTSLIVEGPADLWETGWGRVLAAKVAVIGVIGVLGAHNHRVVVPGLLEQPDDPALIADLRRTTGVEACLFVLALALTGVLVLADAT